MERDTNTPTNEYTLTEEGGRYVIRRPSGEVVFRVLPAYRSDAYELLANLNKTPRLGADNGG